MPSPLTLDLLFTVLSKTLFHPFIAWLIPLTLRSLSLPLDHPRMITAYVYASIVTLYAFLAKVDRRLAWGKPRDWDSERECVVITGGTGGLGSVMVEMFARRGVSVVVLDVTEPKEEAGGWENVHFYRCDVGDVEAVQRVKEQMDRDDLRPTILINNAAVMHAIPLLSTPSPQLTQSLQTNLHAHFHTLATFLPALLSSPTGGTIVSVASVLGFLGPANLSAYAAAKAGVIALHQCLRAELALPSAPAGAERIRTILVTPGQLSTPLFAGVETPSNFFGPVVEPVELGRELVEMIVAGRSGWISLPFYAKWIEVLGVLPFSLQRVARWASGVDWAMEGLVQRRKRGLERKD